MSKQQKNLSLNTLKKQNAKTYKDKKRIHFDNGDKLDVDVVFQPTKIMTVIQETLKILTNVVERRGKEVDANDWVVIAMASIIKNFTSIETDADGFEGLTELSKELNNAKYYDKIVGAFDQKELEKVFMKSNDVLQEVNRQLASIKEKSNEKTQTEVVEENGE